MPRRERNHCEPISCLVIGNAKHSEMLAPVRWLKSHDDVAVSISESTGSMICDSDSPLELIVFLRPYPGAIPKYLVDELQRGWPLATMISLNGSWCEGEGRSGRPEPGVLRFPAASFVSRMRDRFGTKSPLLQMVKRLPRLASEAERILAESGAPLPTVSGAILIAAPNHETYEALSDAVALAGLSSVWHSRAGFPIPAGIAGAIWDASRGDEQDWEALVPFALSVQPAPVCLLLGFPRVQDFRRAYQVSSQLESRDCKIVVLPKPMRLAELCNEFAAVTCQPAGSP